MERIWSKIERSPDGCWLWTGALKPNGYGNCWAGPGYSSAHRVVYELLVGPVPGFDLDHLCRVRHCVNPSHLEPVTRVENTRRGLSGVLKTHCAHGHPWIPENIIKNGNGSQTCKVCTYARNRDYRRRQRETRA